MTSTLRGSAPTAGARRGAILSQTLDSDEPSAWPMVEKALVLDEGTNRRSVASSCMVVWLAEKGLEAFDIGDIAERNECRAIGQSSRSQCDDAAVRA